MDKKYIVHLTDSLIAENGFDEVMAKLRLGGFFTHAKVSLECGSVKKMNAETLGRIMNALGNGNVAVNTETFRNHIHFTGDCEELLRDIVSLFLATVIRDRLSAPGNETDEAHRPFPPYRVSGDDTAGLAR